ncbi:rCG63499 [Rattus norvegicus]|uniref:RCG63499 n=1 Tax=Rattus norvegicus TaxID=10116 RepID=A6HDC0_RAT|nr:rCG63499 [Rattus norvegicus]
MTYLKHYQVSLLQYFCNLSILFLNVNSVIAILCHDVKVGHALVHVCSGPCPVGEPDAERSEGKCPSRSVGRFKGFFFFFFFFSELGTEPRALRLLGKCSTTELNPQPRLRAFEPLVQQPPWWTL